MKSDFHPLVSIVIPCYNHENFVQECIQSIIDQTYQNIELIIIDDGSKDNSVAKIQEMVSTCENRFIRFEFRHRPNKGLCATLNEALDWCQGKYFCPIASDDIMLKEKTVLQVKYLENNINCYAVFGNINLLGSKRIVNSKSNKVYKYNFENILLHKHNLPTVTQMARLDRIKEVGGYSAKILLEDWYMELKLAKAGGTLDYIPYYLAYYRRHNDNLSSKIDLIHNGRLEILELYREHYLYKKAVARAFIVTANSMSLRHKPESFKYYLNCLKCDPNAFLSRESLRYLTKLLIPKENLRKILGE